MRIKEVLIGIVKALLFVVGVFSFLVLVGEPTDQNTRWVLDKLIALAGLLGSISIAAVIECPDILLRHLAAMCAVFLSYFAIDRKAHRKLIKFRRRYGVYNTYVRALEIYDNCCEE